LVLQAGLLVLHAVVMLSRHERLRQWFRRVVAVELWLLIMLLPAPTACVVLCWQPVAACTAAQLDAFDPRGGCRWSRAS